MKRVLVIAYYFPPIATSGSVRPAAFCRYLPDFGWTPTVVTTDGAALDPPLPEDHSLCDGLPSDLDVFRVWHNNPNQLLLRARDWVYALCGRQRRVPDQSGDGEASASNQRTERSAIGRLLDPILERVLSVPDPQKFWRVPALRASEQLITERRPDVILATGMPWTSLLIGKRLSERHGIPLVADFRDPWATNPYATYSSLRRKLHVELMEAEVCTHAAAVIANTDELAESFRAKYPYRAERVVAITNGFDASLLRQPTFHEPAAFRLEMTHFGSVYTKRSPLSLFQALLKIVTEQPDLSQRLGVNFIGEWNIRDPLCNRLACELEQCGILKREARIGRDECLSRMACTPVLLVLQEGTPMQIPAKLYEYIAMRRPLVILGGIGATANLVQKHHLGLCCPNVAGAIESLLRRLLNDPSLLDIPNQSSIMPFEYRNLTSRLAWVLDQVSAGTALVDT